MNAPSVPFIVVVTGGRDHAVTREECGMFLRILDEYKADVVREGGAPGVDTYCARILSSHPYITIEQWDANWNVGKWAGAARNAAMLDGNAFVEGVSAGSLTTHGRKADLLIAFPGGIGTRNCISKAFERKITVLSIERLLRRGVRS
jgi:hypothetical protein